MLDGVRSIFCGDARLLWHNVCQFERQSERTTRPGRQQHACMRAVSLSPLALLCDCVVAV